MLRIFGAPVPGAPPVGDPRRARYLRWTIYSSAAVYALVLIIDEPTRVVRAGSRPDPWPLIPQRAQNGRRSSCVDTDPRRQHFWASRYSFGEEWER